MNRLTSPKTTAWFLAAALLFAPGALRAEDPPADAAPARKTLAERVAERNEAAAAADADKMIAARFDLSGAFDEKGAQSGFGPAPTSVRDFILNLRAAVEDETIDVIVLRVQDFAGGAAVAEEIHGALLAAREKKPVHAFLSGVGLRDYYLASAASTITAPPTQWFLFTGMGLDLTYFKRMLAKIGIEMEVLRMGKYKNALEPFAASEMSDATRESYGAILDTLFEETAAGIARGRGLEQKSVEALMGGGPFEAEHVLGLGLIDYVRGEPGFEDFLRLSFGESLEFKDDYGKKDGPDFASGNPFTIFQTLLQEGGDKAPEKDAVALVYMTGGVVDGAPEEAAYEDTQISAYPLTRLLDELRTEEKVKAVVIRVDSGGGSAMASDRIWEAVERLKAAKPVVVSMGTVAGSGGYYVAMGAHYIYALPMTITGSIGVIGGKPYMGEMYDWVGLDFHSITRGRRVALFDSARRWTQEERDIFGGLLESTYEDFVSKAALGRKMTFDQVHAVAQGRVWSGRDAVTKGLIDATGGLFEAIDKAEELAGFDPAAELALEVYPRKLSLAKILERAFGMSAGTAATATARRAQLLRTFGPAFELLPGNVIEQALLMVDTLQGEGVAVMLPFAVSIN